MILIDISSLKRETAVNVELSHDHGDRGMWLNQIRKTVEKCREQSMPFKFCWFETNPCDYFSPVRRKNPKNPVENRAY